MENQNNIRLICPSCTEEKLIAWQESNKTTLLKPGDIVKIRFTYKSSTEWMWVIITKIDGEKITGTLDNKPIICKNLKAGCVVKFNRKEISELYKH